MHFGENQLSPSLIGLSPLPTAHPPGFQPWWVRSSTRSYPRFNLAMGRSLGFRYYFTPLPGYFSPFPHGTCPLSVTREYSGLAGGPARFTPNFTGSVLLGKHIRETTRFRVRGSHPLRRPLPEAFH